MKIVTDIEPPIQKGIVKEVPKQKILIATIRPQKGQFLWQYNVRTKEFKKRQDFQTTALLGGSSRKQLDREPDCIYAVAINKENAAKKIIKIINSLENLKN